MGLAKRIIPCLDVDRGRVVKGVQFVDIVDAGDPVEIARQYCQAGADELTVLDITASHEARDNTFDMIEKIAGEVFIPLTVGGGVRSLEDIRALLNAGADKVAINTAAVFDPDFVQRASDRFGAQCIVVAIDPKQINAGAEENGESPKWEIFTHGGRKPTGLDAIAWAEKMTAFGAGELLVTSMDRDGTRNGFDNVLMREITKRVTVPVIASGGVGNLDHLVEGIVEGGADAVLAASIFHFGHYSIAEAKAHMAAAGIEVRV